MFDETRLLYIMLGLLVVAAATIVLQRLDLRDVKRELADRRRPSVLPRQDRVPDLSSLMPHSDRGRDMARAMAMLEADRKALDQYRLVLETVVASVNRSIAPSGFRDGLIASCDALAARWISESGDIFREKLKDAFVPLSTLLADFPDLPETLAACAAASDRCCLGSVNDAVKAALYRDDES